MPEGRESEGDAKMPASIDSTAYSKTAGEREDNHESIPKRNGSRLAIEGR